MPLPKGLNLEVSVDCDSWVNTLPKYDSIIDKCCELICNNVTEGKVLENFPCIELSIVLCDDAFIHSLNHEYREKDKATNVLSFSGLDENDYERYVKKAEQVPEQPFLLGEIYISFETVQSEAETAGIWLEEHFTHMIIHGVLHLLGYDHIKDDEAEVMEALETKLLKNLAIDDPYAA